MKIKITAGGIHDSTGAEIEVGTVLTVKSEPAGWAGRYVVIDGEDTDGKTAITNPDLKGPFVAKDGGSGWWSVHDAAGNEVGKKLRAADAEAFNDLSDDDKLAFLQADA